MKVQIRAESPWIHPGAWDNFGCDACGYLIAICDRLQWAARSPTAGGYAIAICGKCTLKYLINYGDYCCSEPLYPPKATSPAVFDSRNCSRAK